MTGTLDLPGVAAMSTPPGRALTEAQWQQQVTDLAQLYGWAVHHHYDSRRSEPGWPDCVLAGHGRVLFIELKTERGKVTASQKVWLHLLANAGCEAAMWRPSDLQQVLAVLGPAQVRLLAPRCSVCEGAG